MFLGGPMTQFTAQLIAATVAAVVAFVLSLVLVKVIDASLGFVTDEQSEILGLDRTEHGEAGFDYGPSLEMTSATHTEPRPAATPGRSRFGHPSTATVGNPSITSASATAY